MKNLIWIFSLVFLFASCDKVDFPYKPVPPKADCPEPVFGAGNTHRNVLLEEFTGFRCPNCPGATAKANNILAPAFGDSLILVSIHASSLSEPSGGNYTNDYRTTEGELYYNFSSWAISAYVPIGLVNRSTYNGFYGVDADDWAAAINQQKAKPLEIDLQMITQYDSSARKACIFLQTEFKVNKTGNFNVVVYVLEDSIVDWQINSSVTGDPAYNSPEDSMYVHRHMLRANVNGEWGTPVVTGSAIAGDKFLTSFNYIVPAYINHKHVTLVAYVHDFDTKEIYQVVEHHLYE